MFPPAVCSCVCFVVASSPAVTAQTKHPWSADSRLQNRCRAHATAWSRLESRPARQLTSTALDTCITASARTQLTLRAACPVTTAAAGLDAADRKESADRTHTHARARARSPRTLGADVLAAACCGAQARPRVSYDTQRAHVVYSAFDRDTQRAHVVYSALT